ncbi:MAG: hypothetical protein QXM38_03490 [Candidatus Aenigmatarchaeota archaeon]
MIRIVKRLSKVIDEKTGKKYHLVEVESDIISYPEVKKHNVLIDYDNVDEKGKIINPLEYQLLHKGERK